MASIGHVISSRHLSPGQKPSHGGYEGLADTYADAWIQVQEYAASVRDEDGLPEAKGAIDALIIWPADKPWPWWHQHTSPKHQVGIRATDASNSNYNHNLTEALPMKQQDELVETLVAHEMAMEHLFRELPDAASSLKKEVAALEAKIAQSSGPEAESRIHVQTYRRILGLIDAQLLECQERVNRHLAFRHAMRLSGETLDDLGADIGIPSAPEKARTDIFDDPVQAFIKFLGQATNRVPLSTTTLDEVESSGCHWALAYPATRRPTSVRDDAVMLIARLVEGGDIRVFGRALGMTHEPGRDDATEADVSRRPWKSRWPRYIRVHHAEFVEGTLDHGVSLRELMADLKHRAFKATARNYARGVGNTDPRRAIMRKPAMELTDDAHTWLRERLEASFVAHGKITDQALGGLDWPEAQVAPTPATGHAATDGVKALVHEVLEAMIEHSPNDFDEHVTRRVCERIEAHPPWRSRYQFLCDEHGKSIQSGDGKSVVNKSIGRWTKRALDAESVKQVPAAQGTTSLIQSYTLLRFSPPTRRTALVA